MHKTTAGPSWGKPFADIALAATIRRVVRQEKIEVIHAHNYEGLLSSFYTHNTPIIYHAHNAMVDELPHFIPFTSHIGMYVDAFLPRRAQHIIAPHKRLAEYLLSRCGCDPDHVSVIPPFAECDQFCPMDNFGDCPSILYTGNLDSYQNLPLLLSAMSLVRREIPHAKLRVATASSQQVPFAEMIHALDFSSLREALSDDVIVVSPRVSWSGYPIKLLNAMAAGRPIVACAAASPCITDGETGLIVADNDVKAMSEAIIRLFKSPQLRRRLGKNARLNAETHFNASTIAKRIEKVYEACLDKASY
jgi:glycosyltransferase involved in cell wall biosynthesis